MVGMKGMGWDQHDPQAPPPCTYLLELLSFTLSSVKLQIMCLRLTSFQEQTYSTITQYLNLTMKTASANLWCVVAEGVLQCSDILEAVAGHHAVVMVRGHREHRGILHTVLTLWHADIVQRRETIQVPVVVSNIFTLFFVRCACNGSRSCTVHSTQATRCNYNWRKSPQYFFPIRSNML